MFYFFTYELAYFFKVYQESQPSEDNVFVRDSQSGKIYAYLLYYPSFYEDLDRQSGNVSV